MKYLLISLAFVVATSAVALSAEPKVVSGGGAGFTWVGDSNDRSRKTGDDDGAFAIAITPGATITDDASPGVTLQTDGTTQELPDDAGGAARGNGFYSPGVANHF